VESRWLLLIYTLPSQPSRKRAYVWRELKRVGAVYLRDGVALLPARAELEARLSAVAERIREYEGTVDLVCAPCFSSGRDEVLVARFNEERATEYREIYHACVRFLRDVLEEVDADQFGFPDVDNLESELSRLGRWCAQVRARDYFGDAGGTRVAEILQKCDTAFERFAQEASNRADVAAPPRADQAGHPAGGAASPAGQILLHLVAPPEEVGRAGLVSGLGVAAVSPQPSRTMTPG